MRAAIVLVALGWLAAAPRPATTLSRVPQTTAATIPTFRHDIAPLLQSKCTPCHFKGGKVFDRYPFDQYETVRKLGLRLNTRLKNEDADLVARWVKAKSPE